MDQDTYLDSLRQLQADANAQFGESFAYVHDGVTQTVVGLRSSTRNEIYLTYDAPIPPLGTPIRQVSSGAVLVMVAIDAHWVGNAVTHYTLRYEMGTAHV